MIITQDTVLDFSVESSPVLAEQIKHLSHKQIREILVTYLSGRISGSVDPLKSVGKTRGAAKASRADFVYATLENLEKDFIGEAISDEDDRGTISLSALRNTIGSGDVITNKFGKACYISAKAVFQHDDELAELFRSMGRGEVLGMSTYLFKHEREKLRSASQDNYIRMFNDATTGSRLEFCELNPDKYQVFYSVKNVQGMPQFIYDRDEKRFINYWWGQPNAFLRPFHEDVVGVDMAEKLLTRNNENDHTLEVCTEYGVPKTKENNYSNKKRDWRPFADNWNISTAIVRETDSIQGVVSVNTREMKKMTIPDIHSSIIAGNPDAMPLDKDGVYDDVNYNQMVNFNPQKVLIQIASNDKKGLGLRSTEDVTVNQRLKAAEILYNRLPRSRPAQKVTKGEGGDSSHVIVTFPEKEGYADENKPRVKVGSDEAQDMLNYVTARFQMEEDAEYEEV